MSRLLVLGAFGWVLLLGAAVWTRVDRPQPAEWTQVVYAAAGLVCHQRPERSFATAGVQWPVCGRCSGLYLAAPFGAIVVLVRRRRRSPATRPFVPAFLLAAVPTVATLAIEWLHLAPVSNAVRLLAALPLGATIGWILVGVTAEPGASNQVH